MGLKLTQEQREEMFLRAQQLYDILSQQWVMRQREVVKIIAGNFNATLTLEELLPFLTPRFS